MHYNYKIIFLFFLLLAGVGVFSYLNFYYDRQTEIIFFDVGQGDSFLLKTNTGDIILVDGGPDWSTLHQLGKALSFFERQIDFLILTHAHDDHVMALPEILQRYDVKKILLPANLSGDAALELYNNQKEKVFVPRKEECWVFNSSCSLCVLPPSEKFLNTKDDNDLSLGVFFDCDALSLLAVGDASSERELDLLQSPLVQTVQVLKISHHGSSNSSSLDFLQSLAFNLAVISVGKNNKYGHPSSMVLKSLDAIGALLWRTDQLGALRIFANNNQIMYQKLFD